MSHDLVEKAGEAAARAYAPYSRYLVGALVRTRDGRALIAVRDHYLSAEIMGINLTKYRTLSFGLAEQVVGEHFGEI